MGVHLVRASSSLRLGSRIVPRTPSSLGKRLAIGRILDFSRATSYSSARSEGELLDPFNNLTHLRALLAAGRLEKSLLVQELASSATSPARRQKALHRYTGLIKELRMAADELEIHLAAAKRALEAKKSP
jgi:hypothetical protein